jgi:hypothetical protein
VPENTTTSTPLLDALRTLLVSHRPAFRQERTFLRAQALILGHLFAFAKRTITQALIALGLTEHDWSSFYRLFGHRRIDYEQLSTCFFRETLPHVSPSAPYVAVVDGVQIPRSSYKMPGTSWLKSPKTPPFRPAPHRAQRFLHLAALLPKSEAGYSRALPLRMEPSFPEKAVPAEGFAPKKQWEAALEGIVWLRANLDEAGRNKQTLLVLGDGDFSVAEFRASLPEEGVILMSRCAKNRALYELPEAAAEQQGPNKRGRRRKYGDRAKKPEEWLAKGDGWRQAHLRVRGRSIRPRYRVEGPFVIKKASERPVFLVVVKGVRRGRASSPKRHRWRKAAFWLVSAVPDHNNSEGWRLPYPPEELLSWAWQRWEVEVCHREMKSGFGLGEAQCWGAHSAILCVRWRAFSYGVLVLAGFRVWGLGRGPIRPPGKWWGGSGRWSLGTLWRGYRSEMWGSGEFRPIFAPTRGGWPKKEVLLAAQGNAVYGSLRG